MWRELTPDDAPAIVALREQVLANLAHPDDYVREVDEHAFVQGHLGSFGVSYGYEHDGVLAAYCALTTDLRASGEDLEFEACSPSSGDVVLAAAMVLPQYRGRSLHRDAIHLRLRHAESSGARRALVQVSPQNLRSLRSLFVESFRCIAIATYADGRSRMLLAREVGAASVPEPIQDVTLVDLDDLDRLHAETRAGRQGHDVLRSGSGGLLVIGG